MADAGTVDYDAELTRYNAVLHRHWGVEPDSRVLDIGCGTGLTTRAAGRLATDGSALGVDVSPAAVERARVLAAGLRNVAFACADAQSHAFAPGSFDLVTSRFGTMFFADPPAAFANIGRALRPAGRLVMVVWQAADRNDWDVALHRALGRSTAAVARLDPFSLAEPDTVTGILRAAGFGDVELTDVREPIYFGRDVDAALAWVRGFACTGDVLAGLDPAAADDVLDRLREMLAAHLRDDGVWFDSRAWLVTARRP